MPKVIDAKSWQLTPASDGRRYSKYPDGNLPTTLASWNLPATINVPAGTSVGVRQYAVDADGWTIAVTGLATGLTYNSGTERIEAANTTAASETATFTLSKSGETPVETTATVALTEAASALVDILWQDALDVPAYVDLTVQRTTKGWAWSNGAHVDQHGCHNHWWNPAVTASGLGPRLQPTSTFGGSGLNGWQGNLARPAGGDGFDEGPALRAASIKFFIDNNEPMTASYPITTTTPPPYNHADQRDGSNSARRRNEMRNIAASCSPSSTNGLLHGISLYPVRTERWIAWAMYLPSDWDIEPTRSPNIMHIMQLKPLSDNLLNFSVFFHRGKWGISHIYAPLVNDDSRWNGGTAYPAANYSSYYDNSTYADMSTDYPDKAVSLAALDSVLRGGWTYWAMRFNADRRRSAEGCEGYLDVYKREEGESSWTHVVEIRPRVTTIGGETWDAGILSEAWHSDPTFLGLYYRCGMYDSSGGAQTTALARPARKYFLGRTITCSSDSNLAGIWNALNDGAGA